MQRRDTYLYHGPWYQISIPQTFIFQVHGGLLFSLVRPGLKIACPISPVCHPVHIMTKALMTVSQTQFPKYSCILLQPTTHRCTDVLVNKMQIRNILNVRAGFHNTVGVCLVYWIFQLGNRLINTLSSDNYLNNIFQNGVTALSKIS